MTDGPWIRPWNYVVKTNKSTSVLYTCVGNFTSPSELNLIIGKCTHIEILLHANQGLQPIVEVPIYGQISNLQIFRPIGEDRDSVLLCIARYKFFVLQWDEEGNEIIIRATGDLLETTEFKVRDRYVQDEDNREIFIIHPNSRLFGLYSGDKKIFKVVVFDNSWHLNKAFEIRLEFEVLDIQFLSGCANPEVVVLYQNCNDDGCMVKIHTLSLYEKVFVGLPWSKNLENGARCLIPVSAAIGGILVLGETKVVYCSTTAYEEIQITSFTTFERMNEDGYQYLIGDTFGQLHLLTIKHENEKVLGLQIEPLGETSIASTISWLGNEHVYVGSSSGDSQLIKLHQKTDAKGACLEVLETYTNLGPIKDFCVVDPLRQGQCQVVTCVGAHKDSSLRLVGNGIYKLESFEMKGIRRMWSLKCSTNDPYDTYLVVSSSSKTQVLAVNVEGNLAKTKIEGFHSEARTLFCHDAVSSQIVQVTERSVRLVSSTCGQLNQEWTDPAGCNINIATANSSMVLLETRGGRNFYYLEIGDREVTEIKHKQLDFEIFCLAINSIAKNSNSCQLAAVGTWKSIQIVSLPDLECIFEVDLCEELIPKSVIFCAFEGISYLLCGLEHGCFLSFMLTTSTGELRERKKIFLGTGDVKLGSFTYQSTTSVFAASCWPTFIYSSYKKLRYSMANMTHVEHICAFNSAAFPDSIAIYSRDKIIFIAVDGIPRTVYDIPTTVYDIPIRLSPLEQASCICYQELSSTYAICTLTKAAGGNNPSPVKGSQIRLLDGNFEQITHYELEDFEYSSSILSLSFSEDDNAYYCVGTEYEDPNDSGEEAKGRIMILLVEGGKLKLVCEKETKGGVSSLNSCNGQLLATVSNGCSVLYNWILGDDGTKSLEPEWKRGGTILPIDLQTHGDFITEEELSTACSKQFFKGRPGQELDCVSDSMVVGDGIYLIAEDSYSLFAVRKNGRGASDLEVVGAIHLDEKINRVRRGSLVTHLLDSDVGQVPTLIFGSENGTVGIIASLPQEEYHFYEKLQSNLRTVMEGGFKHEEWRSLYHGKRSSYAKNFVDGNFIESFYYLNCEDMELLSSRMDVSVDELFNKVLELGSLSVNAFRVR